MSRRALVWTMAGLAATAALCAAFAPGWLVLAGLTTMELPASSAGASLLPSNDTGKFHGTIAAQTPMGRRSTIPKRPSAIGICTLRVRSSEKTVKREPA